MSKEFRSDNTHGCVPEILEAIVRAATGTVTSYGGDPFTQRLRERFSELFETEVEVFPVITGTAGNALSIAAAKPDRVVCHEDAHILRDEDGSVELLSGAKLVPVAGAYGKLHPEDLPLQPGCCLSLTNATEAGTVYSPEEVGALSEVARRYGVAVHLDGARFANAVASLECAPADLTWRAGVDILSFGATKNGAFGAEAIVVFRRELAAELAPRHHRSGHRPSKMRLLSAQLEAYVTDDLWLRNARHTNAMARRLRDGVANAAEVVMPVDANIVFLRLPPARATRMREEGYTFLDWPSLGENVCRLVCGFSTTAADVDALLAAIGE